MSHSRILVVEDEALVAADIEQRLQHLGYEVAAVVDTGEEAVSMARGSGLDLALMDIRLRGRMTGIEAAHIIRAQHQIPVVYLTSHADADTLARAGSTEPFGFIVKPFREDDLHATIEMAFCRARAEERMVRMERWLTVTLESIGDGVLAIDLGGRINFINRMAERLTGWSAADALGRALDEVFSMRIEGGAWSATQMVARGIESGMVQKVSQRHRLVEKSGREYPVDLSAAPISDAGGNVVGAVIVFRDRTEQEDLLEQRLRIERKLLDTQKLESLGVLAGGIAHDFNNLLTGIVGNTSLAMDQLPEKSEVREYLADVRLASHRAADLIRQMLAYSGRGRFIVEPADLNTVVKETARLIHLSVSKKATLHFDLGQDIPPVLVDTSQIRQVVMNLVINASEALEGGEGAVYLRTRSTWADRAMLDAATAESELPEGHYVMLEVRDTGRGISPENLRRIFDPFFTTKFTGRGLGLAAVIGIVRGHKGALSVESELGRGTVFRILLPSGASAAAGSSARSETQPLVRGAGTVLVVDDEPLVGAAAAHILKAHGFDVELASEGARGVETFASDPKRFRLVLLDLSMPGMDGLEAFTKIRRIDRDARIVLMSGYSEQEATAQFSGRGLNGFLQKPFDIEALSVVVKTALA